MVLRTPDYLRLVLSSCNLQMFSLDFLPQRAQSVQHTTDGIMFYGLQETRDREFVSLETDWVEILQSKGVKHKFSLVPSPCWSLPSLHVAWE